MEHVALPVWELWLCKGVWSAHSAYAWYRVWAVSGNYYNEQTFDGEQLSYAFTSGWLGGIRDATNFEWNCFFDGLPIHLTTFLLHCLAMRVCDRGLLDQKWLLPIWFVLFWMMVGWPAVAASLVLGLVLLTVGRVFRCKMLVWIAAGLYSFCSGHLTQFYEGYDDQYRFAVAIGYKLLQCIDFCVEDVDSQEQRPFFETYLRMMRYSLYPPYSASLIVSHRSFSQEWKSRDGRIQDKGRLVCVFMRVIFWTVVNELLLNLVYNNAMMSDGEFLSKTDLWTLASVGYTVGQFFHNKYVAIFGINTAFALLDGMKPPKWPPVCISRVALYSHLWRQFDRGLYAFLRDRLFIPVAAPSFSFARRLLASFICFSFVWWWHGTNPNLFMWAGLNFAEVSLENLAKEVYKIPAVRHFVYANFSPLNWRRVRAFLHIFCVALGIFSIFYFLDTFGGAGNIFVWRFLWPHPFNVAIAYLFLLGYCFTQWCMEFGS